MLGFLKLMTNSLEAKEIDLVSGKVVLKSNERPKLNDN